MLIDARTLDSNERIVSDICIVGSGPAGITLAREFAKSFRVCLLESGGVEPDAKIQELNDGETVGEAFVPLITSRQRQFGGTANIWDSRLDNRLLAFRGAPLDEVDFEEKEWLPYSGWPFGRSHLAPFYERAQQVVGFGPYAYEGRAWQSSTAPQLPLNDNLVATTVWQFGPQDTFTYDYYREIKQAENIVTYLNANVVEIEANETGNAVTALRVACLEGNQFRVESKVFILATGGIENARLLLLSNTVQKAGLGNEHDIVGRFFMEHPFIFCGTLIPSNRSIFNNTALYDVRRVNDTVVMGMLKLTDEVKRREELLNMNLMLLPQHNRYRPEAVNSLKALLSSAMRLKRLKGALKHGVNVVKGLDYVALEICRKVSGRDTFFPYIVDGPGLCSGGGWSDLDNKERRYSVFKVLMQTEQAPDPDNRITLSDSLDQLGLRKTRLRWKWGTINIRSTLRTQELMAAEVARANLGSLDLALDDGQPRLLASGLHHHMGATRMHVNPKQGVVDENCRVHGISNLFIAGCSVFPSGGHINPTLTIIALSLRLTDHVKQVMKSYSVLEAAASRKS